MGRGRTSVPSPAWNRFSAVSVQANKGVQRQTLLELAAEGQALREELDSMIALPYKSRADSVRIVRQYGRLESIVKSLKNNDNP